jgi:hypothetical protein
MQQHCKFIWRGFESNFGVGGFQKHALTDNVEFDPWHRDNLSVSYWWLLACGGY